LRMIAGLEEISGGKLYIGDQLVNDVPPKDRDIAMVFQNYALYPHWNVYDNMSFALKLKKMPKAEIYEKVKKAVELLGLEDLLKRKPSQLSGGQRQRVALGRAIVREPQVFLMDEPLSNLDAKLRVQMRAELKKLHNSLQTTTIYVTHDQTEAMTMGDRLVVLNKGRIQQVDTPLLLYNHPNNMFVAGFIGSPAMNFLRCKLIKEQGGFSLINGDLKLNIDKEKVTVKMQGFIQKDVVLGIRPEDIVDADTNGVLNNGSNIVRAEVEVMEPMGSETFVWVQICGRSIIAKAPSNTCASVGKSLRLAVDMSKAHLFDPDTEENISLS
ncbi:MAG: ATP-binding cassette domain-containing protein, partial [Peptococcaceae bacterium]|nr:ATP-binding cassette domain-containing protein [Peptococcaceae bacterium]